MEPIIDHIQITVKDMETAVPFYDKLMTIPGFDLQQKGSAVIEDDVTIAAQVGIKDHVRIGKGATIGAKSAVKDDIEPGKVVLGIPAKDGREFAREMVALTRLTKNINKIFKLLKSDSREA